MKIERMNAIAEWLKQEGIKAVPATNLLKVSRDDMCNSRFKGTGIPEETTYPKVLAAIENQFFYPMGYMWTFKNDDDLFLDTLDGN